VALGPPSYTIRRATPGESELIGDLRLASLLSLEVPGGSLQEISAFIAALPDVDADLVRAGRYFVAERRGELIGGVGWSVLPLGFRPGRLLDEDFRPAALSLDPASVLVRGFFLDPDFGRRAVAAHLLPHMEFDAAQAGHESAELIAPSSAEMLYRGLGFRPVRRLFVMADQGSVPLVQMRKRLPLRLRSAA